MFNARGSFEAEVEVSDRVRPGVIASTKGHWLKHVRGGANVNATVEERDADMAAARSSTTTASRWRGLACRGMPFTSREVRLASRPEGEPQPSDFELAETEVADPADGELIVRNTFMSVDPYMRGRMSDAKSYAAPYELGEVMHGGAVGEVVASGADGFARGRHRPAPARLARVRDRRRQGRAQGRREPASPRPPISACSACPA